MTGDDARQQWEEAARRHLYGPLIPGVELQPASAEEHERHRTRLWKADHRPPPFDLGPLLSEEDRARGAALTAVRTPPLEHMIHWMAGDQVVGSYWGVQELQAGFVIAGFEIEPRHGILVHLRLYLHDGLGRLFAHRVDGSGAAELRAAGVEVP